MDHAAEVRDHLYHAEYRYHAGNPKNKEDLKAYIDKCREHERPNRTEHLKGLYRFLQEASNRPLRLAALPFFEVSWLVSGIGQVGIQPGEAASALIREARKIHGQSLARDYKNLYSSLIKSNRAIGEKTFRVWCRESSSGKPVSKVRIDSYNKLIQMVTLVSRIHKEHKTFWSDIVNSVCPGILPHTVPMPEDLQVVDTPVRVAVTGNIGTEYDPVYVPFITLNLTATTALIKQVMEGFMSSGNFTKKAEKHINIPALHTQSVLWVSAKESLTDIGSFPALKLMEPLEVVENRMRNL